MSGSVDDPKGDLNPPNNEVETQSESVEQVQTQSFASKAGTVAADATVGTSKAVGRFTWDVIGRVFGLLFKSKPGIKLMLSFFFLNFFYNELTWSMYNLATTSGLSTLWGTEGKTNLIVALDFSLILTAVAGIIFFTVILIGAFRKMNLLSWLAVIAVMAGIYLPLFFFDLFSAISRPWLIELVYFSTALALVIKNNKTFIIRWLWGDVGVHQEQIDGDENC
jgi:hypothetical protein